MTGADLNAFLLRECVRVSAGSAKGRVAELRSLMRFLHLRGLTPLRLGTAVPPVGGWRLATVPPTMAAADVQQLLDHCPREGVVGIRDYAILMLLARLGLRSIEVARLQLDDFDWRLGEIAIRGKGRREDRLPLPVEVGEALVAYLSGARPREHSSDLRYLPSSARTDPGGPGGRCGGTGLPARRIAQGGPAPAAARPGRGDAAAGLRADGDQPSTPSPGPGHDRALREGRLHRTARGRSALARTGGSVTALRQALVLQRCLS